MNELELRFKYYVFLFIPLVSASKRLIYHIDSRDWDTEIVKKFTQSVWCLILVRFYSNKLFTSDVGESSETMSLIGHQDMGWARTPKGVSNYCDFFQRKNLLNLIGVSIWWGRIFRLNPGRLYGILLSQWKHYCSHPLHIGPNLASKRTFLDNKRFASQTCPTGRTSSKNATKLAWVRVP